MSWFFLSLASVLSWGLADVFYKKSSDSDDRYSHLKLAVHVGLVMGIAAFILLPFSESGFSLKNLAVNALKYAPASLGYIISMVIGYAGMRYLEVSIISPVQNASGALSMLAMLLFFLLTGRIGSVSAEFSPLDMAGTGLIVLGVIALSVAEKRLEKRAEEEASKDVSGDAGGENSAEASKRFGALALLFPLLYCLFDTLGTAADGIILSEEAGLGLGEIDVLILYGLTFFLAAIVSWMILLFKNRTLYNPLGSAERPKLWAALSEEFGQVFYVYAMAARPVLAAPMIASYCIVSVLLSRIFLKEKLKAEQYACVFTVVLGIVLLGISEGIGEGLR